MSPPPMSPPPREAQRVDNRTDAQKALLGLAVQQSYTREIQVLTHKRCPSVDTQERSQCSHTREIQVLKDFRVVTQKRLYLRYILLLTHKRGPRVIYKKYHFVDIQDKSLCYTPEISLCCYSREVIKNYRFLCCHTRYFPALPHKINPSVAKKKYPYTCATYHKKKKCHKKQSVSFASSLCPINFTYKQNIFSLPFPLKNPLLQPCHPLPSPPATLPPPPTHPLPPILQPPPIYQPPPINQPPPILPAALTCPNPPSNLTIDLHLLASTFLHDPSLLHQSAKHPKAHYRILK